MVNKAIFSRPRNFAWLAAIILMAWSTGAASASTDDNAMKFISALGEKAVTDLAPTEDISVDEREQRFRTLLHNNFDVKRITRFALGRYARRVTKEELAEFSELYEDLAVLNYAQMFGNYAGQGFTVLKQLGEPNARYIVVVSELSRPDGTLAARLDWQLRVKEDGFAVVDIRVEGVSMAIAQRDEFTAFLDKNDGNMQALLDQLRIKVDGLREKRRAGK